MSTEKQIKMLEKSIQKYHPDSEFTYLMTEKYRQLQEQLKAN